MSPFHTLPQHPWETLDRLIGDEGNLPQYPDVLEDQGEMVVYITSKRGKIWLGNTAIQESAGRERSGNPTQRASSEEIEWTW